MSQLAKTIYFSDYPKSATGRSGLTIPFREIDGAAYSAVAHLSSYSIRELIGYESFSDLEDDARGSDEPAATYARSLLLKRVNEKTLSKSDDYRRSLQATFQGGRGSPLHDWYPYLEGYSPDFVNSIIDTFSPKARTILDPFCGSGTTALIATLRGLRGFYSEVNPVCRFVTDAKLKAIRLPEKPRKEVTERLEKLASNISSILPRYNEDKELKASFVASFGKSVFFDKRTFATVLRLRALADDLAKENTMLSQLFVIAVLRSLVAGSLLVRRGDLRFRTSEELKSNPPNFIHELGDSLRLIASDLHDAPHSEGSAKLVCADARLLADSMSEKVDAIITSPPYLNGTNYFRNTKIELWFLRELQKKSGLRVLRDAAITAGINDVTTHKARDSSSVSQSKALKKVMEAFVGNAYDTRIPLMVQSYFGEMSRVIDNFTEVVAKGGTVAIDLGDSCYGSVWVQTDTILAELMQQRGFEIMDRVVLRERQSRDGRKLSQTLQVFRRAGSAPRAIKASERHPSGAPTRWSEFKNRLPHQQGEMAKRNWGHPLHSLCSYQGKLKPALAHNLVRSLLVGKGKRLLDPFAGVGTIPFEAQLLGHTGYGFDISPAALAISKAKIERINSAQARNLLEKLAEHLSNDDTIIDLEAIDTIRFNGPLSAYFHKRTLREIIAVRNYFLRNPPTDGATALVFSAMLHILHGNRPYALSRNSHPITPFAPTGPTEYRPLMSRLADKVERSLNAIENDGERHGKIFYQDATKSWPKEVTDLDAVITSPPFFDSTRFHTANWMRLWFAGWEAKDFQMKPASFVDERQKVSFDIYRSIFQQCGERIKPGGFVLIHLGKSRKCDMAKALEHIAADYLTPIDTFTESVEHCESHGIRDKGTVTHHQYVLLRRAA